MLDDIETLYGQDARSQAESTLGGTTVGELPDGEDYPDGAHDNDTVGLNTLRKGKLAMSRKMAALVLMHELIHVQAAKDSATITDPTTKGSCGACNHAIKHFELITNLTVDCEELLFEDPQAWGEMCSALLDNVDTGGDWLDKCSCPTTPSRETAAEEAADAAQQAMEDCCVV